MNTKFNIETYKVHVQLKHSFAKFSYIQREVHINNHHFDPHHDSRRVWSGTEADPICEGLSSKIKYIYICLNTDCHNIPIDQAPEKYISNY